MDKTLPEGWKKDGKPRHIKKLEYFIDDVTGFIERAEIKIDTRKMQPVVFKADNYINSVKSDSDEVGDTMVDGTFT